MSYLSRLDALTQKRGEGEPAKGAKAPSAPFDGSPPGRFHGLPADLVDALARLRLMDGPATTRRDAWRAVVADAVRLAEGGWASQALALGWSPMQLWGWSPERVGVASWLDGGVPLFSESYCTVREGAGSYRCMDRRPMPGAVLLWELGGG